MSAQLSPTPVFKAFDNNGAPLMGGLLWTYAAGTNTPQPTYVDSTQTTPNTNPVVLNLRGECNLWLDPTLNYKFSLTDSGNQPIWTVDNITGSTGSGTITVGPPVSGPSLTVNVNDNSTGAIFNDLSPAQGYDIAFQNGGVNRGLIGTGPYALFGTNLNDFVVGATTNFLKLVGGTGTIVSLVTGTVTTNAVLRVQGSGVLGSINGLSVLAGTNTSDYCFAFANYVGNQQILSGMGDGEVFVAEPPAAATPFAGTHQVGYLEAPGNTQNGNYTLAITDRGKTVKRTGATGPFTYSIPPASSVAFPQDTIINIFGTPGVSGATVISPGAGVTLTYMPSAATGARTGAAAGFIATIYQAFQNAWYIWGSGLS